MLVTYPGRWTKKAVTLASICGTMSQISRNNRQPGQQIGDEDGLPSADPGGCGRGCGGSGGPACPAHRPSTTAQPKGAASCSSVPPPVQKRPHLPGQHIKRRCNRQARPSQSLMVSGFLSNQCFVPIYGAPVLLKAGCGRRLGRGTVRRDNGRRVSRRGFPPRRGRPGWSRRRSRGPGRGRSGRRPTACLSSAAMTAMTGTPMTMPRDAEQPAGPR